MMAGGTLDGGPAVADPTRLDQAARRAACFVLIVTSVVIAVIVLWPGPPDHSAQAALQASLDHAHEHGLPQRISFNAVQDLANVVMFLPVGLFGSLALRRHNYLIVLYGALAAGCIELTQLLLLPGRVASIEDVISNTLGAFLGLMISLPWLRRRIRRRRRYLQGRRGATDSPRRTARAARI